MKKYLIVFNSTLFFLIAILSSALAIEITADMISKEGKIIRSGKMYVKDKKYRVERGATPIYVIVRGDKNLIWQVNGVEGTYAEFGLTPEMRPNIEEKIYGETGRKLIGTETVNGFQAKKYEVTVKRGGKTETYYQWFASEVSFPARVAAANGSWTIDYKNIKKGSVADNLFDLRPGMIKEASEAPDVLH